MTCAHCSYQQTCMLLTWHLQLRVVNWHLTIISAWLICRSSHKNIINRLFLLNAAYSTQRVFYLYISPKSFCSIPVVRSAISLSVKSHYAELFCYIFSVSSLFTTNLILLNLKFFQGISEYTMNLKINKIKITEVSRHSNCDFHIYQYLPISVYHLAF